MSTVAICFFILACGWNFYRDYTPTRTKALRNEGHPQYFGAALCGAYIFLLATCLHEAGLREPAYSRSVAALAALSPRDTAQKPVELPSSVRIDAPAPITRYLGAPILVMTPTFEERTASRDALVVDSYSRLFAIALWCALLAVVGPWALNLPFRFNRALSNAVTYSDLEEIERMAVLAISKNVALLVTLVSNKFYVGFPLETSQDGSAETKWIMIQPLASGHRVATTGKLEFTTAYDELYDEIDADLDEPRCSADFRAALPVSQIASVQLFDLDLYTRHFEVDDGFDDPELGAALGQISREEASRDLEQNPVPSGVAVAVPNRDREAGLREQSASNLRFLALAYSIGLSVVVAALPFSTSASIAALVLTFIFWLTLFKPDERQLASGARHWRWMAGLRSLVVGVLEWFRPILDRLSRTA